MHIYDLIGRKKVQSAKQQSNIELRSFSFQSVNRKEIPPPKHLDDKPARFTSFEEKMRFHSELNAYTVKPRCSAPA